MRVVLLRQLESDDERRLADMPMLHLRQGGESSRSDQLWARNYRMSSLHASFINTSSCFYGAASGFCRKKQHRILDPSSSLEKSRLFCRGSQTINLQLPPFSRSLEDVYSVRCFSFCNGIVRHWHFLIQKRCSIFGVVNIIESHRSESCRMF